MMLNLIELFYVISIECFLIINVFLELGPSYMLKALRVKKSLHLVAILDFFANLEYKLLSFPPMNR